MFQVVFYTSKDGKSDVLEYLDRLQEKGKTSKTDRVNRSKILAHIQALQENGTRIGSPFIKHIEENIWELRPLNNRIFFIFWKDNTFVLLHHYIKKSQKTPRKEIEQARLRQNDFIKREGKKDERNNHKQDQKGNRNIR